MAKAPSASAAPDIKYTVFIKLPFPRGSFVDPPNTNWNAAKEAELWRTIMTSTPGRSAIDWEELAEYFDAPTSFVMQQAAWLLNRLNTHVRGRIPAKHVKQTSSSTSIPLAGQAMRRAGSGQGSRAPSALSVRPKISTEMIGHSPVAEPIPSPVWKTRAPYSRTTSTTTITQLQRSSTAQVSPRQKQRTFSTEQAPGSPLTLTSATRSSDESSDGSSSSEDERSMTQSRMYSRRQRFRTTKGKGRAQLNPLSSADEDSGSDSPPFLPFSALTKESSAKTITATGNNLFEKATSPSSSGTLSSTNQPLSSVHSDTSPREHRATRVESRAQAALSPRLKKLAKEESESTLSMGSSFSDLDDASISRSAMEEALAREIKAGRGSSGVTSRLGEFWRQNGPGGAGNAGLRRN